MTKPREKTREELTAEIEESKKKIRQFKNREKIIKQISPFLSLLAGLAALRAANRRLIRETPEKPRSRAQLFGRFCALGTRRGFRPVGFLPAAGNRSQAFFPAWENRSHARARTRKRPRACEVEQRHKPGARIAHRRCARRSRAGVRG